MEPGVSHQHRRTISGSRVAVSPSPAHRERGWGEGSIGCRKRRILLALLAIQVILIVAGLAYWYRTPTAPALPPLPSQPAPRINGGATYESALPIAQAQAVAGQAGPRPVAQDLTLISRRPRGLRVLLRLPHASA